MTVMAGATISPALPLIGEYFKSTPDIETYVRLVFTTPALFIVLSGPLIGFLVDKFGRKPVLAISLILYGISGSAGLYLDSMFSLLISRAFLGTAVSGVLTCTTTLIADYFSGTEREKFMGKQSAFMGLGGIVFLVAGGVLALISWRGPFAVYLLALAVFPTVLLWITEPEHAKNTEQHPDNSSGNIPWKSIYPLYLLAAVGMVLFNLIPVQLPFYLKEIANSTPPQIGIAIAWMTLCSAIASVLYSKIRQSLSFERILAIMFFLIAIGFISLGMINTYPAALVTLIFCGLGFGLFMPNNNVMVTQRAPEFARGRVVGGLTTCLFLGQFLSPLLAQPIININGIGGILGAYGVAAILACVLAVGFLISSFVNAKT